MWGPEKSLGLLPEDIRARFMLEAGYLLAELVQHSLRVVLVPAPDPRFWGHKIRVAEDHNPAWYSEVFWRFPHWRRDRTLRSLKRLSRAEDKPSSIIPPWKNLYDAVYRELILSRLLEGYETVEGYEIPPSETARAYFKEVQDVTIWTRAEGDEGGEDHDLPEGSGGRGDPGGGCGARPLHLLGHREGLELGAGRPEAAADGGER